MDPVSLLQPAVSHGSGKDLGGSGGNIKWDQVAGHLAVYSGLPVKEYHLQTLTIHFCSVYQSYIPMPIMLLSSVTTGYVYIE